MGGNELGLARLEADVLLSTRAVRPLTAAERDRLATLLGRECELRGIDVTPRRQEPGGGERSE